MNNSSESSGDKLIELSASVVSAYVSHNALSASDLPKLIAATEAGELDGHINAVTKAKQPTVMKR